MEPLQTLDTFIVQCIVGNISDTLRFEMLEAMKVIPLSHFRNGNSLRLKIVRVLVLFGPNDPTIQDLVRSIIAMEIGKWVDANDVFIIT